jgi:KaiC/GvpD/RAD55 family RecA-like ATPase
MRIELCPSGVDWIDGTLGGIARGLPTLVTGAARAGKTCLALSFVLGALRRGSTCFVTTDVPESVLDLATSFFDHDLRDDIRAGRLTLLSASTFLESKVRSLGSAERPLAELRSLVQERSIEWLAIDGVDPLLFAVDRANAKPFVREIVTSLQQMGTTTICTARSESGAGAIALDELRASVCGSFEVEASGGRRLLRVRSASWCAAEGESVEFDLVQGRGFVTRDAPVSLRPRALSGGAVRSDVAPEPAPKGRRPQTLLGGSRPRLPDELDRTMPLDGSAPMPMSPQDVVIRTAAQASTQPAQPPTPPAPTQTEEAVPATQRATVKSRPKGR